MKTKNVLLGVLLLSLVVLSGCDDSAQKIVNVQEVKYIAKYHNTETVTAPLPNVWYALPFNDYVLNESTQGFVLAEDNKSIIVEGFTGIVRVGGCLHPYSTALGNEDAIIYARVLVNGVEKRCTQASRSKAFRSGGVDILPISGTIFVEHGDVITMEWQTDNTNVQLLELDSAFDFPVSHTIHFERMK